MKLWEIIPTLKPDQMLKGTTKAGRPIQIYMGKSGQFYYGEGIVSAYLHKDYLEADYEVSPQYIPFEDALKALREGKAIRCGNEFDQSFQINPDDVSTLRLLTITFSTILDGKWWIVE